MRIGLAFAFLAVHVLGVRAADATAAITTGALQKAAGSMFVCRVTNVGLRHFANVQLELVDEEGALLSLGADTVASGTTLSTTYAGRGSIGWCRVTGIGRRDARVTLCVANGGECTTSIAG